MVFRSLALVLVALGLTATVADAARLPIPDASATLLDAATIVGTATDSVDVLVGLRGRHQARLDRLVAAVSDPDSPRYGKYLSPAQFRARFAPPQSSVTAVGDVMRAAGLRVASVPRNRAYVEVKGGAAAASLAFGSVLRAVRIDGRLAHLPTGVPSVAASLRGIVTGVEGLDTTRLMHPDAMTYPPATVTGTPCSNYYGEKMTDPAAIPGAFGQTTLPYATCGYTPDQLQSAYGVKDVIAGGLNGAGQKVAIIDAFDYPNAKADADTYSGKHGLPAVDYVDKSDAGLSSLPEAPGNLLLDPEGWSGEQQLDVEAIHTMAPGAQIVFHGATTPLNPAFTMAQNAVVDNKEANIVSNSYGGAEDDADSNTDAVLKQAAATGIGFYFSSGDQGDETKDPAGPGDREVDTSANNPMATGVGGTSLAVGPAGQYEFETGWGTYTSTLTNGAYSPTAPGEFNSGGGGGTSQTYAEPDYQKGVVPDSIASYFTGKPAETSQTGDPTAPFTPIIPGRAVPDVAMLADPNTGFLMGQTQDFTTPLTITDPTGNVPPISLPHLPSDDNHYGEFRIGGTSLAAPLFAGLMALADQAQGTPHGFANPALYKLNGTGAFHDVVDPASMRAVVRINYKNGLDASGGTDTLLRTLNQTNTIHTVPGYDDVTGLGSPVGRTLLARLAPNYAPLQAATPTPTATASASATATATATATSVSSEPLQCKRHKIAIRLKHRRRDRLVKVRIRFAGATRNVHRKHIRNVHVVTPKATSILRIDTRSRHGQVHHYKITLTACGRVS